MDQRLLKILGGETKFYPSALESQYPRILAQIMTLWDKPGMDDYFMGLLVSDRENRAGFPPDVAAEIMRLSLVYASSHKPNKKHDIWDIPTEKFANFKPPVAIGNANEWKPLPVATKKALEKFVIPDSALGFHRAVEAGIRQAVALFLEARVNTEIQDERGWTPLMKAAFNGHQEIVGLLVRYRANVHATDLLGNTALHWAVDAGQTECSKLLIDSGAEIDSRNNSGLAPLFRAVIRRRLGDVLLLVESGANSNSIMRDGSTILHKAAALGYIEIVRTLVKHGADPGIQDKDGNLPLALALKNNQQDVIRFFTSQSAEQVAG